MQGPVMKCGCARHGRRVGEMGAPTFCFGGRSLGCAETAGLGYGIVLSCLFGLTHLSCQAATERCLFVPAVGSEVAAVEMRMPDSPLGQEG